MNRVTGGKETTGENDNQDEGVLHVIVFVLQSGTGCAAARRKIQ
ncbi:MAG: hypothetical protein ABJF10_24825 [Chthoniobacter sp.]